MAGSVGIAVQCPQWGAAAAPCNDIALTCRGRGREVRVDGGSSSSVLRVCPGARPGASGFALQIEAVHPLHQPVQNNVGDGGIADPAVPVLNGKLMGDDGGPLAGPVTDEFEQVTPCAGVELTGAQSSRTSTSIRAILMSHMPKLPLECSARSSFARRGVRRYSTEFPRRQAY